MNQDPIVITGYARTPIGGFQGELTGSTAPELGSAAVRAAVERAGIAPGDIDQIIMGCVLSSGLERARPAGGAGRRPALVGHGDDGQQDVWLRNAGRDDGA